MEDPQEAPPLDTEELDLESARRFRAAFAWAGIVGPTAIGQALGVSSTTAKRLARGDGNYSRDRWDDVERITKVPRWFIDAGFEGAGLPDYETLPERVEALGRRVQVVMDLLGVKVSEGLAGSVRREPQAPHAGPANGTTRDLPD
jgi:hypothetical protein